MELVILLIIWLISPIVLLIIAISQGSKAKDYQRLYTAEVKKNLKLENELKTLKNPPPPDAEAPPESTSAETAQPESTPAESDEKKQKRAYSPYDMSYQTAASVRPVQTETPKPESKPEPEPAPKAEKAAETPPPAEKKPRVSSINVLFIIGALFIITAGLIFATTTWEFLSSGIRAIVILSLSAIFFAASSLAERKFNLQKTGMLFYTLGSVFLPITLVAAGYFKVFGEWFSLDGEGRPLLLAITFAALSAVSLKGGCDYKSKPFSWCGLVSFSAAVSCLILQFTESMAMFALISSVYSFGMIFACAALSKITSEKFSPVISQLNTFASANTIILSISSLAAAFGDGEGALTFASCAIFAAGYLKNSFTQKNGFAGAVPFTIFATCGVFAVSAADDMSGYAVTLVFATAIPAVLSFMNFFHEKLKTAVTIVSNIFSIFAAALCAVTSFFAEPSVLTLAAYVILAAEVLALYIFHKNKKSGQVMLSVFPVPCLMIVVIASRFIFEGTYEEPLRYTALFAMALIAVLQALFILIKPLKLRTSASDYIFSSAAVIACTALLAAEIDPFRASNILLSLAGVIISSGTVLMPIIGLDEKRRLPFIGLALLWTGTAVFPLYDILPNSDDYAVTVACGAVMLVHAVISVLAAIFCKDSATEKLIAVITRIASGIFIIASLPSSFAYPLFLILTAAVIFRGVRHNNNTEFGAGLILFFMTILVTSIELLDADFHDSWMFASGAAAIVYLSALFMPSGKLVKTADSVSRYTLLVLNSISLIYICDMYSPEPVFIAMTALFFLLTLTSFYNVKHTPPLFLPLLLIYPAIVSVIDGYSETIFVSFVIAAVALLTLIPSFILHRERLFEKDDKLINMDVFAFARFAAFSYYMGNAYDDIQSWCGLVLLTICILSLYRKTQPVVLKKWIFTVAAFVPVIAWISQPFFIVPDIIVLEYSIIPFLLFCFAMRYMWKDSLAFVDNLTFAVYIISFLVLFFDAMTGEYVADGLIIVISALAMLIFSFIVKKKKWFILGVTVIVTATLFMSRNFWASLAWWVYLLAAGLLLIAIAAANELKKQAAAKNEKSEFEQKLTRFMSEWTW